MIETVLVVVLIVLVALALGVVLGYRIERARVNEHEDIRAALTKFECDHFDAAHAVDRLTQALDRMPKTITISAPGIGKLNATMRPPQR